MKDKQKKIMEFIITAKKEFMIKLFCFLMVVALGSANFINGKSLDCEKCVINFKSFKRGETSAQNEIYQEFKISVKDLHKDFLEDICLIEWIDEDNGFLHRKDLVVEI